MIHSVVHLRGAVALILLNLCLSSGYVADAGAADFTAGVEAGHGVRHNDDGNGLFFRGLVMSENGAGCGVVVGAWDGDFENDVAGLTCEKRFFTSKTRRPVFSIGAGVVTIDASPIVNSDWALEARLRIFITRHVALAYTHYSNAGYEHPNRGYNFVSLEFLFQ